LEEKLGLIWRGEELFAQILHRNLDQFLIIFGSSDLIGLNHRPHSLECVIFIVLEVLLELEVVEMDQAHNFATSFYDFVWHLLHPREVFVDHRHARLHYGWQLLFVEIREFFLREYRLDDMKDRIHNSVQVFQVLLVCSDLLQGILALNEHFQ